MRHVRYLVLFAILISKVDAEPGGAHLLLEKHPYLPDLCPGDTSFVEQCFRRLIDPTYVEDLEVALATRAELIRRGTAAIEEQDFDTAEVLLDSIGYMSIGFWSVKDSRALVEAQQRGLLSPVLQATDLDSLYSVGYQGYLYSEEKRLHHQAVKGEELRSLLAFRRQEEEQAQAGALFTRKDTFERLVEMATLHAFDVWPRLKGMTRRPFLTAGDTRFLKGIDRERDRLTLKIRTNDCYDIDFKRETVSLVHPLRTLENYKQLVGTVFLEERLGKALLFCFEMCNQFDQISEVVVAMYYPGEQSGTEIVVAQFGIRREHYDERRWRKLRVKDGTFQDFLKVNGTYWLHPEIPDLGTPRHLLRR